MAGDSHVRQQFMELAAWLDGAPNAAAVAAAGMTQEGQEVCLETQ